MYGQHDDLYFDFYEPPRFPTRQEWKKATPHPSGSRLKQLFTRRSRKLRAIDTLLGGLEKERNAYRNALTRQAPAGEVNKLMGKVVWHIDKLHDALEAWNKGAKSRDSDAVSELKTALENSAAFRVRYHNHAQRSFHPTTLSRISHNPQEPQSFLNLTPDPVQHHRPQQSAQQSDRPQPAVPQTRSAPPQVPARPSAPFGHYLSVSPTVPYPYPYPQHPSAPVHSTPGYWPDERAPTPQPYGSEAHHGTPGSLDSHDAVRISEVTGYRERPVIHPPDSAINGFRESQVDVTIRAPTPTQGQAPPWPARPPADSWSPSRAGTPSHLGPPRSPPSRSATPATGQTDKPPAGKLRKRRQP